MQEIWRISPFSYVRYVLLILDPNPWNLEGSAGCSRRVGYVTLLQLRGGLPDAVGSSFPRVLFLSTIIFSTPLHKVRHFQFCHAILDVTYGALGMCTAAQRF